MMTNTPADTCKEGHIKSGFTHPYLLLHRASSSSCNPEESLWWSHRPEAYITQQGPAPMFSGREGSWALTHMPKSMR